MQALLQLLEAPDEKSNLEQVELHRELGQFEEAAQVLQMVKAKDNPALHKLSAQLIEGRRAAPVRYRS